MPMQVIEVRRAFWSIRPEVRNRESPAHSQCGLPRKRDAGVARCVVIVIGTDHDVSLRMLVANGMCHSRQVTRMEGDGYRVTSRLMDAGPGRETLGNVEDVNSFAGSAIASDPEAVALDRSVPEESLGSTCANELQGMQLAHRVADGNDQRTPVNPQSMGLHTLA